jgi:hypothetical protein
MAHPAQHARGAVVSLFHFETVGQTVPFLVPGGSHGAPMGGTSAAVIGCTGGCWEACGGRGGAHHGQCVLDFLDGLSKGGVGCNQVVNGCIFLDGCVGKVIKGHHHLLCLFKLHGFIEAKGDFASSHVQDVVHLCKNCRPM